MCKNKETFAILYSDHETKVYKSSRLHCNNNKETFAILYLDHETKVYNSSRLLLTSNAGACKVQLAHIFDHGGVGEKFS